MLHESGSSSATDKIDICTCISLISVRNAHRNRRIEWWQFRDTVYSMHTKCTADGSGEDDARTVIGAAVHQCRVEPRILCTLLDRDVPDIYIDKCPGSSVLSPFPI